MLALIAISTLISPVAYGDDLPFAAAVESFVAAAPGAAPPPAYGAMIDALGRDCWRCREIASRRLQAASRGDLRWLFWGLSHPDPEIRLRCDAILRRLNPCPSCDGSGRSKHYPGYPCWDCHGLRTSWRGEPWE